MKRILKLTLLAVLAINSTWIFSSCARMKEDLVEMSEERPILK